MKPPFKSIVQGLEKHLNLELFENMLLILRTRKRYTLVKFLFRDKRYEREKRLNYLYFRSIWRTKKPTINGLNIQEKSVVNFADFFATLNWNMAFNYKQYKNRLRD